MTIHRRLIGLAIVSLYFSCNPDFALGQEPVKPMKQNDDHKNKAPAGADKESPFACNVSALNVGERLRWLALLEKLKDSIQAVRELPDGFEFRFPAESAMVKELAEFVTYERLCCPFFGFEMVVQREGGPLWLRLKGREGVKEFIRAEFGLK
jgi:hypothetical protein